MLRERRKSARDFVYKNPNFWRHISIDLEGAKDRDLTGMAKRDRTHYEITV